MSAGIHHFRTRCAAIDGQGSSRISACEAATSDATVAARPRPLCVHAPGCGNGELAYRLAPSCAAHAGIDAVTTQLIDVWYAAPRGHVLRRMRPCRPLKAACDPFVKSKPPCSFDAGGMEALGPQLDCRLPGADVVGVCRRGRSGHARTGEVAVSTSGQAMLRDRPSAAASDPRHRIDVFLPLGSGQP